MKRLWLYFPILFLSLIGMTFHAHAQTNTAKESTVTQAPASKTPSSAYDFTFTSLTSDKPLALSDYKGQVIMVVNTASKCGFTGQYDGLEALYTKYKDQGFVIIGVPSNDFGQQEPGTKEEIASFCKKKLWRDIPHGGQRNCHRRKCTSFLSMGV